MEQDCVVGLYQSVGRPLGEHFTTDDISQLFGKVFHEPSNSQEVDAAITKISNGNSRWTCAGQNVLDVLREMEHRRVKNEKLYWEKQLWNAMNYQSSPYVTDSSDIAEDDSVQKKGDIFQLSTQNNMFPSTNTGMKKKKWSIRKLKKAHRHSWARLLVEGLYSLLPFSQTEGALQVTNQAWGGVTVSDLLLLVEVKYDAVSSLLYTEMLRQHCSESVWESLSPWEQHQAEEGLRDEAERALESHDLVHLAQLPGAFNMYRFQDGCWSAVSFLCEIDTLCQQEKTSLEGLSHRLDLDCMKLLCLHIRLATLRAQREALSYSAVVAARQSWDTWPDVSSPLRAEQAMILLMSQYSEQKSEALSKIPQQAVLQLLVLTQEQERRQLIKLVQGLSLYEVQEDTPTQRQSEDTPPQIKGQKHTEDTPTQRHSDDTPTQRQSEDTLPQESRGNQADVRRACVRRLHQIYSSLKRQSDSEPQLPDCVLQLLMDLLRLQEVQTCELLAALVHKSPPALLLLQEELRSALQAPTLPKLLQLLTSDLPSTFSDNTSLPQTISCNVRVTSQGAPERDSSEQEQAADAPREADVCSGCGAVMAGLPYLEVLCAADRAESSQKQEASEEEASIAPEDTPASLITLAWSNPQGPGGSEGPVEEGHLQPPPAQVTEGQIQPCSTVQMTTQETVINKATHEDQTAVEAFVADDLLTSSTNSSNSEQHQQQHQQELQYQTMDHEDFSKVAVTEGEGNTEKTEQKEPEQKTDKTIERTAEFSASEKVFSVDSVSAVEQGQTMRTLVDMQRRVEQRQQRDRERQLLKVQERLSIVQNRKAEEDPLGLKDRLKLLTHDLPQEDVQQQKAVVKERLEQLRRERSYILQSKRDKNTAGFKELLGPTGLHNTKIQEDAD